MPEERTAPERPGTMGAVIVTHNSARVIERCLQSLMAATPERLDIVVVDNASSDDTLEILKRFPPVRVISNARNKGFAGGVNQGIRELSSRLILLLNPDTEVKHGLSLLPEEFQQSDVGAAAGLLVDRNGKPQTGFGIRRFPNPSALVFEVLGLNRVWPGNPVNRHYRWLDGDFARPADVQQPAGAFLVIRKDLWEKLGGFDEGFHPVWFEEVDYLRRLSRAGFRIRFQPAAVVEHEGAHSFRRKGWEWRQVCWYASLCRYSAKHFKWPGRLLVSLAVLIGFAGRTAWAALKSRSVRPLAVYIAVAGRSVRCGFQKGRLAHHASRPDHQVEPVELKGSLTRS